MARIRQTRPAITVAIVALIAVAGTALAGPAANTSAPAKKIAKQAKKKAKKALKAARKANAKAGSAQGSAGAAQEAASSAKSTAASAQAAAGAAKSTADAALARSVSISYSATENTPTRVILNVGGLVIRAGCSSGPDLSIVAQTTAPLSNIHIGTISEDGASHGNGLDFWNGGDIDLAPDGADNDVQGTLTYSNGDTGTVVTVTYSMAELVAGDRCQVVGNALAV